VESRTLRITVRGAFDGLSAEQRAELLAHAAEHDIFRAAHTPEGHLAYDIAARPFFTFRFCATVAESEDIPAATAQAEAAAVAWLSERGYGFKNITSQAVDMSAMPLGSRGRKRAAQRS
jgi:hypothetical protein